MATLDMSLDDLIRNRRGSERGRGRGRGSRRGRGPGGSSNGGRMTGAPRRGPLAVNARQSSFAIAKSFRQTKSFPWQRDLFEDSLRAAGLSGVENGTKLYISNLDAGVSNEDIKELFSEIGQIKRYTVHYDKSGRSSGSAEVVFVRRSDAFQALKRYNNVHLDGKPMKIEIIGTNSDIPVSAQVNVVGGVNGRRTVVMPARGRGRGGSVTAAVGRGSSQRGRGGLRNARGGRGRGRGGSGGAGGRGGRGGAGRKKAVEKSADELDKELDGYHAEAMQT